jgi:hypothetical protein
VPPHRIDEAVDRLVFDTLPPRLPIVRRAGARRLQARYRDQRANLFVFLDRPAVIHRKVTGGYRSWSGADVSAVLTTARKRGHNLFHALRSVAGPSPLHAAGLPS